MLVVKQYVKKPIFDGKEQSFRNRKKTELQDRE